MIRPRPRTHYTLPTLPGALAACLLALALVTGACQPPVTVRLAVDLAPVVTALPAPAITPDMETPPAAAAGSAAGATIPAAAPVTATAPAALTPSAPQPSLRAPATAAPDRMVAPAIGLDTPVVTIGWALNLATNTTEWQTADFAAGFHEGSALPGWRGNTVLSGHHNIKGQVFAHLHELRPGDEVDLYVGPDIYRYRVEDSFIVPERDAPEAQRLQNARWIASTDDERLTMVTCWPANDNSHRVIVIARPVP